MRIFVSGFAAVGQKLYLCGGVSRSNTVFVSNVQSFDVETLKWEEEMPLSVPLHSCAAAGVGGVLYVSGGCEMQHGNATSRMHALTAGKLSRQVAISDYPPLLCLLERYLTDGDGWKEMAAMRLNRRDHAMVACDSTHLIVCGGMSNNLPR